MIRRQHVVSAFFEEAESMREALDERFRDAYTHSIDWHYFCDPRMYAYMRAASQRVFPRPVFELFLERLRRWCMENLGLAPMNLPSLHLMINGCRLGLHSDFHNGTWGYVYSLTRWENRVFVGGETLLLRDGVPSYKKHHVHGDVLYELFPAHFNQLLIFDDRIVHATPIIEGSMDPLLGRIALVGHIRATSPVVEGGVASSGVRSVVLQCLPQLREQIRNYREVQGTITFRLSVAPSGRVQSLSVLTDNLVTQSSGYDRSDAVDAVRSLIRQTVSALRFPVADATSNVIVPILVPLPDLRPIELSVPHGSSRSTIHDRAAMRLLEGRGLDLDGAWEGETFDVRGPIAGTIRILPSEIVFSFDPPMWVPSQRESFQTALLEWASHVMTRSEQ